MKSPLRLASDWQTVYNLSEAVLSIDPDNTSATSTIEMSRQLLEVHPVEVEKQPPAVAEQNAAHPDSFAEGRYTVKEFLGEGARKKVYLAHDTVLDRDVAFTLIKTEGLDEDAKRRVVREAQMMGKLGAHTHIVTVHDMGKHEGQQYVVMELMAAGDLADAILAASANRMALRHVVETSKAICRGLEYALPISG
jgi:hypothetical protein